MMDNPFNAIPTRVRTYVYLTLALIGLALGALNVGLLAAAVAIPAWLTGSLAALPFLMTGLGFTAATHVPAAPDAMRERQHG